ncbi:hypothetical protein P3X46_031731 [Hevea brasiliensis]|uniref:GTD-binding domain-containing protein n=1 Tax=Hevea brasiliensis TaxID=3981 RepID=A0ABQ9KL96_HEVBR|nr:uncharacterized protein LOC110661835 [Hevea brasiliensis]XP_021676309.2 uncharacterized protein LOC110661835 [Hevea brasiliensis]XP_057996010.1 uncharacterized protein LOC110661835 [Hevea brasiliensis]XP_057996011.1 uncharacterized protein LOC110661835 [Hevea brasiliensis]XP_057996012.1 uncharacterized protein LOC110661835 [Hevea brasiliensis]XP_057996013.1 uncharacterized protein LOC110661835 [Hevea brasiliensis]XP_057996014.1 uncharacterized protein LOC110661835 [Hevea brasiliensis]KAJ9
MVPETDITALEEALYAQQKLLQKLNTELDVEREAAATAASEALSMILRLQGEKASLKMEASQYKRMAEEKMCHAEEALAIFEDLIYQREMEIASLEFQVQAYRYRLLSMGCNDLGVYEIKFPENLLIQRNDNLLGDKCVSSNVRRLNSQPQAMIKDPNHKKSAIERKRSVTPVPDSIASPVEENMNQEIDDSGKNLGSTATVDLNSYWEQIKKLDERVKEISESKDSVRNKSTIWKGGTWSPSLFSQVSIGTSIDPVTEVNINVSDQENSQAKEATDDPACSSSVQDVFEVPQTTQSQKPCEPWKKEYCSLTLDVGNRHGKPDSVTEDTLESPNKHETDRVKAILLSTNHERKLTKPRNASSLSRCVSPVFQAVNLCNSSADYQQLSWRIDRLERARNNARQEIIAAGEEELNILKEIRDQLKSIEFEMKSCKAKKSLFPNEPSLDPLQEAMLYFWM